MSALGAFARNENSNELEDELGMLNDRVGVGACGGGVWVCGGRCVGACDFLSMNLSSHSEGSSPREKVGKGRSAVLIIGTYNVHTSSKLAVVE